MIRLEADGRTLTDGTLRTKLSKSQGRMIRTMALNRPWATYQQLYDAMQTPFDCADVMANMRKHSAALRVDLVGDGWPNIIKAYRGFGYGLTVTVDVCEAFPLADQLQSMVGSICLAASRLQLLVGSSPDV